MQGIEHGYLRVERYADRPRRTAGCRDGGRYGWPADERGVGANRHFTRNVRWARTGADAEAVNVCIMRINQLVVAQPAHREVRVHQYSYLREFVVIGQGVQSEICAQPVGRIAQRHSPLARVSWFLIGVAVQRQRSREDSLASGIREVEKTEVAADSWEPRFAILELRVCRN